MYTFSCLGCQKEGRRYRKTVRYNCPGLGSTEVILEGVDVDTCEHCGLVKHQIFDRNELEKAIALELITDTRRLSLAEFSWLRLYMLHFDPDMLARTMGVTGKTVERWEMGSVGYGLEIPHMAESLLRMMVYALVRPQDDDEEPFLMIEVLGGLKDHGLRRTIRVRFGERTVRSWTIVTPEKKKPAPLSNSTPAATVTGTPKQGVGVQAGGGSPAASAASSPRPAEGTPKTATQTETSAGTQRQTEPKTNGAGEALPKGQGSGDPSDPKLTNHRSVH